MKSQHMPLAACWAPHRVHVQLNGPLATHDADDSSYCMTNTNGNKGPSIDYHVRKEGRLPDFLRFCARVRMAGEGRVKKYNYGVYNY